MSDVPSNLIPTRITGLPEYLGTSTLGYLPYVIEGNTYKVQFANIAAVGAVPSTREINTGSGLGGGGDLSANRTLYILPGGVDDSRLSATGVTAGTYGAADSIPVFTVNAQGRVTGVTNTPIVLSGYVPTSRTITAGAGLTGGGDLSANRTLAVNFSSTTPEPLGPGSSGVSTVAAREDHVHPAVDLSDTTETQGVLPLSRGGTGNSLSPVVGAIAYSSNDRLNLTPTSGNAGDVLVSAGGLAPPFWQAPIGGGTVTSINASGGTTGMSFTGGPVTTIGTLTLGGTLGVANGGTGATDAATALTNLGAYPASNPAGYTSNVGTVTSVSGTGTVSGLSLSGTVTSAGSLTLGGTLVVTPSDFASQSANTVLAAPNGSAGVPTFRAIVAADIPTLNQNTTGTAGNVSGIVAVVNGGTGASVAGTARTNLGAAASGANTDITSIALTTGTISTSPTSGTDIVNKLYADSIASGINFHQSVRLATAAALPAYTYNNGTSGVGATITANANAALSVDGVAVVVGNRILVKNESGAAEAYNGVYTVTQTGSGAAPYILTRATDFDSAGSGVDQIDAGDFFLVTAGSTQSNTSWVQQTPLPITVGTTALVFTQFAAPVLYSAGTGLTLAGTVFSITNTGVSASTYGSASSVPVLAINAQGQVTSASSSSIAIAASQITSGTVTVAQGGTGATTLTANGVLLGNGTSAISATAVGATGQVLVGNTGGAPSWATLSGIGVTSFAGGTTGLTPSSGTTGAITLAGTLNVANGGTGTSTAFTAGSVVFAGASGVYTQDNANLFWDNTNDRLGIGTATPSVPLDVTENGVNSGLGYSNVSKIVDGSGNKGLLIGYDNSAQTTVLTANSTAASSNMTFWTYEAGGSGWAERMRVTAAGNLGVGTSSPAYKLDVNGVARLGAGSPAILAGVGGAFVGGQGELYTISTNTMGLGTTGAASMQLYTNSTERMRIDSSGNVGIGTSSPVRPLHAFYNSSVVGAYTAVLQGAGGGYGAGVSFQSVLTGGALAEMARITADGESSWNTTASTQDAGLRFYTALDGAVAQKMRLDASGELFITGTGNGTLNLGSSAGAYSSVINMNSSSGGGSTIVASQFFSVQTTGSERARIDSSGNLLVGGTTALGKIYLEGDTNGSINTWIRNSNSGSSARAGVVVNAFGNSWSMGMGSSANNGNALTWVVDVGGANTERMRIDTSGNVGIGTSSPGSPLDVQTNSSALGISLRGRSSDNVSSLAVRSNDGATIYGQVQGRSTDFRLEASSSNTMTMYTNSTERMRITSQGDVAIGTTGLAYSFTGRTVLGIDGTNSSLIEMRSGGTQRGYIIGDTGGIKVASATGVPLLFETNGAERARIDISGNLGVGTSAPKTRLQATAGGSLNAPSLGSATNAPFYVTTTDTAYGLIAGVNSSDGHVFLQAQRTDGTATAYNITLNEAGGNVLVGTTTSAYGAALAKFSVEGGNSAASVLANTGGTSYAALYVYNKSTTGNNELVGFGTEGTWTARGSISYNRAAGLTAYNTTSDYRAKDILGSVTDAGATIDALKVYNGKMKGATVARPMLIAHEAQEVTPYAVTGEKDAVNEDGAPKFQQMDVSSLVPLLIAELQSLRARVAQLEGN